MVTFLSARFVLADNLHVLSKVICLFCQGKMEKPYSGGAFADGGQFLASAQSWSKVPDRTAARRTSMRSAAGRDQRMPGPARRCLKRLMPLSTVPEPMG